jgi:hypothetical protein
MTDWTPSTEHKPKPPIDDARAREVYSMASQWLGGSDETIEPRLLEIRNMLRAEFDTWLAEHDRRVWEQGFEAAWRATGEGHNGECPDEGVSWHNSAGREEMQRVWGIAHPEIIDGPFLGSVEQLAAAVHIHKIIETDTGARVETCFKNRYAPKCADKELS